MKLNYNFAKKTLKQDGTPDYAPATLTVITQHYEEWDEEVLDPETGEPTGRTEHKAREWEEKDRKLWPGDEDYLKMDYIPVEDKLPEEKAPEGMRWEKRGWKEDGGKWKRIYEAVQNPPPAPRTFSKMKCVAALAEAGLWDRVKAWIQDSGLYDLYLAAQDFREDNEYFVSGKASLQQELGLEDGQVEAVLEKCVAEEY